MMNFEEVINKKHDGGVMKYSSVERSTITVKEVAKYIGISHDMVYKMVRQRQIPHIRIGSRIIFKIDSIDAWLDELEDSVSNI